MRGAAAEAFCYRLIVPLLVGAATLYTRNSNLTFFWTSLESYPFETIMAGDGSSSGHTPRTKARYDLERREGIK